MRERDTQQEINQILVKDYETSITTYQRLFEYFRSEIYSLKVNISNSII
jgi:hypothetical protein